MLQSRINELNSAIIDLDGRKVHVTGFTRKEMLQKYLNEGIQCYSSIGLYENQELDFRNLKNNALIIVRKEGKEINRNQYKKVLKDTVQYKEIKDGELKIISLTFTIRKSVYSDNYHFLTESSSLLFNNKDDLNKYLLEKFNYSFLLNI